MLYVKKILLLFQLEFTSRTGLIFVFLPPESSQINEVFRAEPDPKHC